ncbi:MAG: glycosyl transferase [Gemmatimonadota bacterium]
MTATAIPSIAHFIWFGREFLWVHLLAIRSAVQRGEFHRVVLHHADDLSGSPWWNELRALPRFEARRLNPEGLLEQARGAELVDVFRDLEELAARANVVRAALLFLEGGTYLDADTVTVGSFAPLLEPGGVFCGREHIIRPYGVLSNPTLATRTAMLFRRMTRSALRKLPGGWRTFRRLEGLYPAAVNNAVLGSEARHRFIAELLLRMVELPRARRRVRYALGTHLLQQQVDGYAGGDLRVLAPSVFYPLGPEISLHWFRQAGRVALAEVLRPDTRLVHWYASVRTREIVSAITPDYVRAHARGQLFSALALPFVE